MRLVKRFSRIPIESTSKEINCAEHEYEYICPLHLSRWRRHWLHVDFMTKNKDGTTTYTSILTTLFLYPWATLLSRYTA